MNWTGTLTCDDNGQWTLSTEDNSGVSHVILGKFPHNMSGKRVTIEGTEDKHEHTGEMGISVDNVAPVELSNTTDSDDDASEQEDESETITGKLTLSDDGNWSITFTNDGDKEETLQLAGMFPDDMNGDMIMLECSRISSPQGKSLRLNRVIEHLENGAEIVESTDSEEEMNTLSGTLQHNEDGTWSLLVTTEDVEEENRLFGNFPEDMSGTTTTVHGKIIHRQGVRGIQVLEVTPPNVAI